MLVTAESVLDESIGAGSEGDESYRHQNPEYSRLHSRAAEPIDDEDPHAVQRMVDDGAQQGDFHQFEQGLVDESHHLIEFGRVVQTGYHIDMQRQVNRQSEAGRPV